MNLDILCDRLVASDVYCNVGQLIYFMQNISLPTHINADLYIFKRTTVDVLAEEDWWVDFVYPRTLKCNLCDGEAEITVKKECSCDGGKVICDACDGAAPLSTIGVVFTGCHQCNNSTKAGYLTCLDCDGAGEIEDEIDCPDCEDGEIEDDGEVLEFWMVSNWLADKLEEKGERILREFSPDIWGRTTSGQLIASDCVIRDIVSDLHS